MQPKEMSSFCHTNNGGFFFLIAMLIHTHCGNSEIPRGTEDKIKLVINATTKKYLRPSSPFFIHIYLEKNFLFCLFFI